MCPSVNDGYNSIRSKANFSNLTIWLKSSAQLIILMGQSNLKGVSSVICLPPRSHFKIPFTLDRTFYSV